MTMDYERDNVTEGILKLTLKILYLLFDEEYIILKSSGGKLRVTSQSLGLGGCSKSQSSSMEPSPDIITSDIKNSNNILKFTNKIIELLTREVPLRCQDVAVYFSMEEWEYLNRHKYRYPDIVTENQQPLISSDHRIVESTCIGTMNALVDHTYSLTHVKARAKMHKQGHQTDPDLYSSSEDTQHLAGDIQKESISGEEQHLPHSDMSFNVDSTDYVTVCIKDDTYICKEEPCDASLTSEEYHKITSTPIKEEPVLYQEFPPYSDTYMASPPAQLYPVHIKKEPVSDGGEVPAEIELYVDGSQCPTVHPKKPGISRIMYSEEQPLKCHECGKHFKHRSGLAMHRKIHTERESYACQHCSKCFLSLTNLETHQKIHTEEKPYSCGECGKRFSKLTNLTNHQRIHATKNPFSCAKCGKHFISNANLQRHQRKHDNDMKTIESTGSECGKDLSDQHKQNSANDRLYTCLECGRRFIKRINLIKHQRLHTRKNLHYCQECGRYFMSKGYLLRHMKGHSKKKRPFPCSLCGKYFLSKLDLTIHQRIHKSEKPDIASEWRKSFIRKLGFVIQARSNMGVKPNTCVECGEQFERKLELLRHQKIHNNEKPYSMGSAQGPELTANFEA